MLWIKLVIYSEWLSWVNLHVLRGREWRDVSEGKGCRGAGRIIGFILIALVAGRPSASAQEFRYSTLSKETIGIRLKQVAGKDSQRKEKLKELFMEAGCSEHLHEQPVRGSKLPNLECVLPGSSDRTIIVGAHFDHDTSGDGVVDNWSGASLLPSLYQAIKNEPRKHTFVFIGFTGEEKGLVGSRHYARTMTEEEVERTDAMVNMDTLGLSSTKIDGTGAVEKLIKALAYIARKLNLPVAVVNVGAVGISDSQPFAERNIPAITIHSFTQEAWNAGILHSPKDKLSAIRMDDYYQTYCLMSAYLVLLDLLLPLSTDAGSR